MRSDTEPIETMIRGDKGAHVHTADVLRAIAKQVRMLGTQEAVAGIRPGQPGLKEWADRLAVQIERLADSVRK